MNILTISMFLQTTNSLGQFFTLFLRYFIVVLKSWYSGELCANMNSTFLLFFCSNLHYTTTGRHSTIVFLLMWMSSHINLTVSSMFVLFTALHGMQTRSSDENSVRLSVCQTRELWQNRIKICPIFIPYERTFSLVFWEKEWLVGRTLLPEIFGQLAPLERNRRLWTDNRS